MSHVSCSLSFPSQRQRYLSLVKYGINLSGVGEKTILSLVSIKKILSRLLNEKKI